MTIKYPLQLFKSTLDEEPLPKEPMRKRVDHRNYNRRQIVDCPFWTVYGSRGRHSWIYKLSPYEFHRHFFFKMASRPWTIKEHHAQQRNPDKYHTQMTQSGIAKLANYNTNNMIAGQDYQIREEGGPDWTPLGNSEAAKGRSLCTGHLWCAREPRRRRTSTTHPYSLLSMGEQRGGCHDIRATVF